MRISFLTKYSSASKINLKYSCILRRKCICNGFVWWYGCTTWTNEAFGEKAKWELHMDAVQNKTKKQHPTKQQLYCHLAPISETIQISIKYAGHWCWTKDEFINDVFLWTITYEQTSGGKSAKAYTYQLCAEIECRLEDLARAMADKDGWLEKQKKMRAAGTPWW